MSLKNQIFSDILDHTLYIDHLLYIYIQAYCRRISFIYFICLFNKCTISSLKIHI